MRGPREARGAHPASIRRGLCLALAAALGAGSALIAVGSAQSQVPAGSVPSAPTLPTATTPSVETPTVPVPTVPATPPADLPLAIGLAKTVKRTALTPNLTSDLSAAGDVIPGDRLTYTATARNSGATLALDGRVATHNCTGKTASVRSFYDYVEYRPDGELTWTPLAGTAAAAAGYVPKESPPIAEGLDLLALPVPADGVSYPGGGDRIVGTGYSKNADAAWDYDAEVALTPAKVELLLADKKLQIRNVFHLEVQSPTGIADEIYTSTDRSRFEDALSTQSGDLTDARLTVTDPGGQKTRFDRDTTPELARLAPGEQRPSTPTTPFLCSTPRARASRTTSTGNG